MSKLDRYANASAGKREGRIFLVFAKLNTKRSFSAFDLMALQDMNQWPPTKVDGMALQDMNQWSPTKVDGLFCSLSQRCVDD